MREAILVSDNRVMNIRKCQSGIHWGLFLATSLSVSIPDQGPSLSLWPLQFPFVMQNFGEFPKRFRQFLLRIRKAWEIMPKNEGSGESRELRDWRFINVWWRFHQASPPKARGCLISILDDIPRVSRAWCSGVSVATLSLLPKLVGWGGIGDREGIQTQEVP